MICISGVDIIRAVKSLTEPTEYADKIPKFSDLSEGFAIFTVTN